MNLASRRTILRGLAAVPQATVPAVAGAITLAPSPDAGLLDLGRRWAVLAARSDEAADRRDAAHEAHDAVDAPEVQAALAACNEASEPEEAARHQIALATATTLDGIMVKVRAGPGSTGTISRSRSSTS